MRTSQSWRFLLIATSSSKRLDFAQLRDEVLAVAYDAAISCAREHNASLGVNTLPFELLHRVAAFLPFRDRCMTVLVCSHWRSAFISAPALWTRIVLDLDFSPELWAPTFSFLADRSRQLPLIVELRCLSQHPDLSEYISPMAHVMPRVRSFSLHARGIADGEWDALICCPAPTLETLRLVESFDTVSVTPEACYLPRELLSRLAPILRHVHLDGLSVPVGGISALAAVESLVQLRTWIFHGGNINVIIRSCPALRSLTIIPTVYYMTGSLDQVGLHRLDHLRLGGRAGCAGLLRHAAFESVSRRCVSFLRDVDASATELEYLLTTQQPRRAMRVEWSHIRAWEADDEEVRPRLAIELDGQLLAVDVSVDLLSQVTKGLLSPSLWTASLETLAVPSDIWHVVSQCPLPALRELDILVRPDNTTIDSFEVLALKLAVRTVRIEAERPSPDCFICPRLVSDFLGATVARSSMQQLVLRGVELLEDGKAELHGLVAVAREDLPTREAVTEEPWYWVFDTDAALFGGL